MIIPGSKTKNDVIISTNIEYNKNRMTDFKNVLIDNMTLILKDIAFVHQKKFLRYRCGGDDIVGGDDVVANDIAVNDIAVNDIAVNDIAVNDIAVNDIAVNDIAVKNIVNDDVVDYTIINLASLNDGIIYDGIVDDDIVDDGSFNADEDIMDEIESINLLVMSKLSVDLRSPECDMELVDRSEMLKYFSNELVCPNIEVYFNDDMNTLNVFYNSFKAWVKMVISHNIITWQSGYFRKVFYIPIIKVWYLSNKHNKKTGRHLFYLYVECICQKMINRLATALFSEKTSYNDRKIGLTFIPKITMKVLFGDFSADRVHIFKQFYQDTIKIISDEPVRAFIWSESSLLWELCDEDIIKSYIIRCMTFLLQREVHDISNELSLRSINRSEENSEYLVPKDCDKWVNRLQKIRESTQEYTNEESIYQIFTSMCGFSIRQADDFVDKMNADEDHLAIADGLLLNIKTLTMRKRTINDYFSYVHQFSFKPEFLEQIVNSLDVTKDTTKEDEQNIFLKYISEITLHNKQLGRYLQYVLGCCLTSDISIRTFFVLYGRGSNGQTLLMNIMSKILGPYYLDIDKSIVIANQRHLRGGHDIQKRWELRDRKLLACEGFKAGDILDEVILKSFIRILPMHNRGILSASINFTPTFKVMLLTKHHMRCSTMTKNILEHMVVIPFDAEFVDNPTSAKQFSKDITLEEKLSSEETMNFFFTWLVCGAHRSMTEELENPDIIRRATELYIKGLDDDDHCQLYYSERIVVDMHGVGVTPANLRNDYVEWCSGKHIRPESPQMFASKMLNFIQAKKRTKLGNLYPYIRLRPK